MKERKQETGTPKLIFVEVGPLTFHGTKAEIRSQELTVKREIDELVRNYLRVGKRNEAVCTSMEPIRDKDGKVMIGWLSKESGLT